MKYTPASIVKDSLFYSIPIYQRLFEWDSENVETLLDDLKKAFEHYQGKKDYYIGMLTSTKDKELVDGQQRFTVMMLMGCVLQKYYPEWKRFLIDERPRLQFVARQQDEAYMQYLIKDENYKLDYVNYKMLSGKKAICDFMENLDNYPDTKKKEFAEYIFQHMCFFISELPNDYSPRDLNKYFERMNTTGKNLEQHEILKVKLLSNLSDDVSMYMTLWNKLADVDTLLIRRKDKETEQKLVWRKNIAFTMSINSLVEEDIINGMGNVDDESMGTIASVQPSSEAPSNETEYTKDSHCALTFPYLLLQTLYWKLDGKIKGNISDFFKPNNLLKTFEEHLPYEGNNVSKEDIKDFMEKLVRCRLALDICFIRPSDYGYSLDMNLNEGNDSLKRLLMLESMLYVSSSNYTNYRWFGWLMESTASGIPSVEELYNALKKHDDSEHKKIPDLKDLCYGEIRYWFWRLDLYIWENRQKLFKDNQEFLRVADNYVFSKNRSIEHVAPQTPKTNSGFKWEGTLEDKIIMNSFGNLVMISQGLNSALQNECFEIKFQHVLAYCNNSKTGSIESLKLLMIYSDYKDKIWSKDTIKAHGEKMYKILKESYE